MNLYSRFKIDLNCLILLSEIFIIDIRTYNVILKKVNMKPAPKRVFCEDLLSMALKYLLGLETELVSTLKFDLIVVE